MGPTLSVGWRRAQSLAAVEVEALDPNVLGLIQAKVDEHWDTSVSEAVEEQERVDKDLLKAFADDMAA